MVAGEEEVEEEPERGCAPLEEHLDAEERRDKEGITEKVTEAAVLVTPCVQNEDERARRAMRPCMTEPRRRKRRVQVLIGVPEGCSHSSKDSQLYAPTGKRRQTVKCERCCRSQRMGSQDFWRTCL